MVQDVFCIPAPYVPGTGCKTRLESIFDHEKNMNPPLLVQAVDAKLATALEGIQNENTKALAVLKEGTIQALKSIKKDFPISKEDLDTFCSETVRHLPVRGQQNAVPCQGCKPHCRACAADPCHHTPAVLPYRGYTLGQCTWQHGFDLMLLCVRLLKGGSSSAAG